MLYVDSSMTVFYLLFFLVIYFVKKSGKASKSNWFELILSLNETADSSKFITGSVSSII